MKIFDEKGITLLELLATLSITMIILPVIYGVFSSGIKLYNKIQVEGQLRDDADYAATMVMNTLYSFPFDYVKKCGDNCIELVNSTHTEVKKVEGQSYYDIQKNKNLSTETSIQIRAVDKDVNGKIYKEIEIGGKQLDEVSKFNNSTINYTCKNSTQINCESAMIHLKFELSDDRIEKTFHLESEFGF